MVYISSERLAFAFDQLKPEDGFEFERFVNAFLIKEIPELRPVAGVHDGARDAFVYHAGASETSFLQSSVTKYWPTKVRSTIAALQKNGNTVAELIYCSPHAVLGEADSIRRELRALGISLDIRDRNYFLSSANATAKQSEHCETFAEKYVNPVTATNDLANSSGILLTEHEEQIALIYLDLQLRDRTSGMALTKLAFDALIKYALRDSSPENLQTREQILASVLAVVPSHDKERVETLVVSALERLVKKRTVNHHKKDDAYTLAYDHRTLTADAICLLAAEKGQLHAELATRVRRVADECGIDYPFDPQLIADDIISILTLYFGRQGQQTAQAFARGADYRNPFADPFELCQQAIRMQRAKLRSLQHMRDEAEFLDIAPPTIEDILSTPSAVSRSYLQRLGDAALLMFFLRETPDVQRAIGKVFQSGQLLVDASYIVPCLAETVLPKSERRFTSLLSAAREFGMALYVGDDVLNELIFHLRKVEKEAEWLQANRPVSTLSESLLTKAYLQARDRGQVLSVESFIGRFVGDVDPKQDLIDTLGELFHIEYRTFAEELASLDEDLVAQVSELWRNERRQRSGVRDDAFDILVEHDVKAFVLVQSLRGTDRADSRYGYTTWWLTLDHTGFRVRRAAKQKGLELPTAVGSCMSPDFLLRYLSINPHPRGDEVFVESLLPLSIELAGVGLVPAELRDVARDILKEVEHAPQYLKRRRLRDMINQAKAESGELLESGVEETQKTLNDGHRSHRREAGS